MINNKSINVLGKVHLPNGYSSDHFPAIFQLNGSCKIETCKPKIISFRNIKQISHDKFHDDLKESISTISFQDDFRSTIEQFNKTCLSILNDHAPLLTKSIKEHPNSP